MSRGLGVLAILVAAALTSAGCTLREPPGPRLAFENVAPRWGLDRILRSGSRDKLWILENIGTGCAFFDADGNGTLDIFVANAGQVEQGRIVPGPGPALYLQKERRRLTDATQSAGLGSSAWQTGTAVGDMDNDGDADLFVGALGRQLLYRNEGDGRFLEVAGSMGIRAELFASSAAFLDFDRDGFLDLYIAGYVRFDPALPPNGGRPCITGGVKTACGPGHCEPEADRLYRNVEGRMFVDVTLEMGLSPQNGGYGLGVACGDFDGDGWSDIYVANDTTANFLWRNVAGKRFEDVALWVGAALSDMGQGQAGMGTEIVDADGDQRLDIFVTNYSEEYNSFYWNRGDGTFEDRTHASGFADDSYPLLGWGVRFVDLDRDGDLDGVVANGHVHPQANQANPGFEYLQRCLFYRNEGSGRFREIGNTLGGDASIPRAHRGLAAGDLDDDGDMDLLLTQLDGPPVLLENQGENLGNWVSLELEGTKSNREGIGAKVVVRTAGREQLREVTRSGSYLSAQDRRLLFGLGAADRIDQVRITWPSGASESLGPLDVGAHYRIREGSQRAERLVRR